MNVGDEKALLAVLMTGKSTACAKGVVDSIRVGGFRAGAQVWPSSRHPGNVIGPRDVAIAEKLGAFAVLGLNPRIIPIGGQKIWWTAIEVRYAISVVAYCASISVRLLIKIS
ncbi:hypothetical protein [Mesorhizobium sp. KR1-2]|uniref:hypothetical protein n=1 Tax=Mesorhizobium sp. KR1-2 TaxID=3156609 RepID=UPI0032B37D3E